MTPGYRDALDGVTIEDLSPSSRVLIWAMRNIVSGRGCDAKLAMGLSSMVEPGGALFCAQTLRAWLDAVKTHSRRDLAFGGVPHRGVTWDEVALLSMMAAAHAAPDAYEKWGRRAGCDSGYPHRAMAVRIAECLRLHGEAPRIPGATDRIAPRHEPEAMVRTMNLPRSKKQI